MKKNGFTLAELLGVMVVLSLIAIITVPAVTDKLNKYKTKLCNAQIEEIIHAAKSWAAENTLLLPNTTGATYEVSLKTLSESGYIDKKINNPVTNKELDLEDTAVTITKIGKKYTYTINDELVNSCYSNGVKKPSSSNLSNKTTIIYRLSEDKLYNGDKIDLKNRKYTNYTKYDEDLEKTFSTNETHDMVGIYSDKLDDVLTISINQYGETIESRSNPVYLKHTVNSEGIITKSETCLVTSWGTLCQTGGEGIYDETNDEWNDPNFEIKKASFSNFFKCNFDAETSEYDGFECIYFDKEKYDVDYNSVCTNRTLDHTTYENYTIYSSGNVTSCNSPDFYCCGVDEYGKSNCW